MKELHTGTKIFLTLFRPIQRLPLKFHYFWGRVFAWVAENVIHYRKADIIINLSRSFPEKKYKEIKKLTHDSYLHLGDIFAEAIWFGGNHNRPGRARRQGIVTTENTSELFASFEENNNIMVLNSHFGNWELTGGLFEYICDVPEDQVPITEDNICVVYKQLHSRFWDEFFHANRCACQSAKYDGYVESKMILRHAIANRHIRTLYIFPTDQYPYRKAAHCDVPSFMNQKTKAMIGGAALAHKLGMPVFYMSMNRREKGKYSLSFRMVCENASEMEPADIMIRYYAYLEEDIKANPFNYLWSHRRWKK